MEAAYGHETFSHLLRMVGRLIAVLLGPLILVMLVGAAPIMGILAAYADEATALLRYFALSLVPFTIVTVALALDRVRERFTDALLITWESLAPVSDGSWGSRWQRSSRSGRCARACPDARLRGQATDLVTHSSPDLL